MNESSQSISSLNNNKPQNTLFAAKTIEHLNADENASKGESLSSNENDCEYVRVIYAYTAKCDGELTITIDEMLRLVEDEIVGGSNQDSWIKVVNARGNMGLIPSNCVQPIVENINLMRKPVENGVFTNCLWYFGNISRQETNLLLNKYGKNGDFLVRDCERDVSLNSLYFVLVNLFIFLLFKGWKFFNFFKI
jgi:hypothetical protein